MIPSAATDHFAARGGLALLHRHWRVPQATRALAIVHGLAEHSARYEAVAGYFTALGYSVHAFDQRGHGESEGPRNHAPGFEWLLDDVERFLDVVRRADPELPLVLLGHSMGGLEVASLLARGRTPVFAAVLSGPALIPSPMWGPLRMALARGLARLAPRLHVPSGIDADALSRDPEVVAAYRADPLIGQTLSAALAAALMRAVLDVGVRASEISVPVMIVHGEDDVLCPVEGSRRFYAGLRPPGCELRTYPGLRHEVLNEPERERVLADISTWLDKHVAPGAMP